MKQIKFLLQILMLFFIGFTARSQDFASTDPKLVKVLGDTLHTKLLLVTIPPGGITAVHSHPSEIIYALSDCTMLVEYGDDKKETFTLKAGQSAQGPPEAPHKTTNIGKTTLKFILVEISQ
ncbi:MAG TPA: cupin domain-containing protein [Parafilimonas sp.]|nr:cupin domain-containing protein [Parafilimonas sp.]